MHAELSHTLPLGRVNRQKLYPIVISGTIADIGVHPYWRRRKGWSKFDRHLVAQPKFRAHPPSLKEVPLPAFMARETMTRIGTLTLYRCQRRLEV
jgi:hypothetical protein